MNILTRKKLVTSLVIAMLSTPITFAVNAKSHPIPPEKMLHMMSKKLELSDQQREQIAELMKAAKEKRQSNRQTMSEYRTQLAKISETETFDDNAFEKLNDDYAKVFKEMAKDKAKTRHAIYQLLTEEQRTKFKEMKAERKSKHHNKKRD